MRKIFMTLLLMAATQIQAQIDTTDVASQYQMDEVVVTGSREATDVRHLPMTVNVVGRAKLTENQRVNILPTLTEQVPGLFVTQRGMFGYGVSNGGSGSISMRGISAGAGQLLVLIDGHPQYQGIYGHSIADAYQTMMAERVEVLRGPASVLYGSNALGGVINIVTRGMKQDGMKTNINLGAGSYGTFQAEVSNQYRSGKFSSTVAAQYARTDNHRPRMGFEQYGGYVKIGYDLNKNWNIYADADLTHFNSSYPGSVTAPMFEADQYITRGVVTAALENHYGNTSGAISIYDNFGFHKINDGYAEGKTPQTRLFRSKDALTGISWYQSVNLFEGNRVTVGVDYQHIYGNAYYTSRENGEVLETQNKQSARKHMNEIAGYVDIRQDIASWLTVDAGLRYDNHSVAGGEWIPQLGLVVRPTATGEFKAMLSKGFRNPTMREMYLYPPSNEELKAERIMNYELSWKQRLGAFSYGINLFYLKGDNTIQTINKQNVNTGAIQNNGIELEAAWRVNSNWSVNTNHSLLHMHNKVVAAPDYKGYIGANYRKDRWNLSAGLQQISHLYTSVGENATTENFTLLNATVGYMAAKGVHLYLKGENLLAQSYEINLGYPMPKATFMGGVNLAF
ncbi:MAG: TonB-dependent receptor [Bacteroidaceae bacterium]|nr:TonB-dependent receptor [Bacteroidaceae bacterium]